MKGVSELARYVINNRQEDVDFELGNEPVTRTVQNAKNLIMIRKGEVPYDRLRGFDTDLFHLPMDMLRTALLPEIDRVLLWEPCAEAVEAAAEMDENNEVIITVTIEVTV